MMQEQMTRLLKKDDENPSEYRIVGWERHILTYADGIKVYQTNDIERITYRKIYGWDEGTGIYYDSFELGIKVGDTWWFSGDIIQGELAFSQDIHGVLNAPNINHGWAVITLGISTELWKIKDAKRIGSIHDKEEK